MKNKLEKKASTSNNSLFKQVKSNIDLTQGELVLKAFEHALQFPGSGSKQYDSLVTGNCGILALYNSEYETTDIIQV